MATGRVPTTANSPLTAKGDLFGYSTTQARVAVGSDGDTLVADSAASTGLRWSGGTTIANPIINSSFQIWQRGTSFTVSGGYTADRWYAYSAGAGRTVSRQVTNDTTNLPNIQYCARVARDSGNSAINEVQFYNVFENVNSIPLAGKTITLSFYARKGANYAPSTSNALEAEVTSGTGTDQNPISAWTGENKFINSNVTLTTTWQRFTLSGTMPATATQLYVRFRPGGNTYTGTAGAADYYEITGIQLDVGSVALPFRTNGGTLQGELAACQRYYYRHTADSNYNAYASGSAQSTTSVNFLIQHPVEMRVKPTTLDYSNITTWDGANFIVPSSLSFNSGTEGSNATCLTAAVTGATQYRPYFLLANNTTSSYIGMSAEL
jgi:hypothetical protein